MDPGSAELVQSDRRSSPDDDDASMTAADSDGDGGDGKSCCARCCVAPSCGQFYCPRRYIVVTLLFIGMCLVHAQRVNIGVAVVSIVDSRHSLTGPSAPNNLWKVPWSVDMIGWLHAVFYVGLLISQVPCGYLVTKFPSHRMFGGCILLTHSLNFLLPLAIETVGYVFTCIIRLLQGLVEGALYPSCYDVMRLWILPEEKSRTGATVLTGAYIGPTLGMIASGLLTHYLGWPYVFYVHGAAGLILFLFWQLLVYERPSKHPTISDAERKLIETKQGEAAVIYEHDVIPWKAIFTSVPVYTLIVCNFARSFVFYMLLTNEPMYLNVFRFTIAENGLFSSLPYAFLGILALMSGPAADWLNSTRWATITLVRKIFTCCGFGLSAFFLYGLGLINTGIMAVIFLTAGVGLLGISVSGWQINHLDLAPRYAGVLVSITMTVGTVAGIINPLIVAALTPHQTVNEWQRVFYMTGAVLMFSLIFYGLFGSGERQSWASPPVPNVRIVDNSLPLKSVPYGTFNPQVKYSQSADVVSIDSASDTQQPLGSEHGDDGGTTVSDGAQYNVVEDRHEHQSYHDSNMSADS